MNSTTPPEHHPSLVEMGIRIEALDAEDLDSYPFGVIQLDSAGRVLAYNLYEEELAQLKRQDVLGKNFFFEVAPCTRVRRFYGRFLDGVEAGALDATFGFVFPFAHGERQVEVSLFFRASDQTVWVVVRG
ncbi:MAG: PAS domain-containing protein [Myxococcota bacterium]